MDAGPWRHWRVQAVRVYPLRFADAAAKKKVFWFTVVAFRANRIHGHLNQQENGRSNIRNLYQGKNELKIYLLIYQFHNEVHHNVVCRLGRTVR